MLQGCADEFCLDSGTEKIGFMRNYIYLFFIQSTHVTIIFIIYSECVLPPPDGMQISSYTRVQVATIIQQYMNIVYYARVRAHMIVIILLYITRIRRMRYYYSHGRRDNGVDNVIIIINISDAYYIRSSLLLLLLCAVYIIIIIIICTYMNTRYAVCTSRRYSSMHFAPARCYPSIVLFV
jgi:hypothetical protein